MRIGIGHDTHRLSPGGPLRLGGIDIPHDRQLVGHSDADVLLHAITDALLGAIAWGDIGQLFPDTDAANWGRDSGEMLAQAYGKAVYMGYHLVNLDCIVMAERPSIGEHREAMCQRIAELLNVNPTAISVKAKTGEGVGAVGRQEVISAECVLLLERVAAETPSTPLP